MDDYSYNETKKYLLSEEEIKSTILYLKEKKKQYHFDLEMPLEEGNVFCKCEVLHGTSNIRFRSDGHIFLCEKLDDEDFSIGTIGDSEEILKKNYEKVKARLMYRIINMTRNECSNCIYNFKCNKGCPVLLDRSSNEKCIKGMKK